MCTEKKPTRRTLLRTAVAAGVLATPQVVHAADAPKVNARELSPKEALAYLYKGNTRFLEGKPLAPHRDEDRERELATAQAPFAAFPGCADSRVPIEMVFDQGFGDLFVTRIAGNVSTPECLGSLEFGTLALGAKVFYVLGHSSCGAVDAAIKGDEVPGQISVLFQHLRPTVRAAKGDLDTAIRDNVRSQSKLIAESSPVVGRLVRQEKLIVAGGVYNLATGKVEPVEIK